MGWAAQADLEIEDGLVLWLQADEGVTADGSGAVSSWLDQSGAGNHAGPRTGGEAQELPEWVSGLVNGRPAIRFDGVDDVLEIFNSPSLQPLDGDWTVLFVGRRLGGSIGDFPQIIGSRPWTAGMDKGWAVTLDGAGLVATHYADGAAGHDVPAVRSATALSNETFQMWQVEENRTGGFTAFYKNGDLDRRLDTAMPTGLIDQFDSIYIGREIGGANNRRANVELAEILIYNRVLTEEERLDVALFLSEKYDLGFAPNIPPTVTLSSSASNITVPGEVTLSAVAEDEDGSIALLEILHGNRVLASGSDSTLEVTVKIGTAGTVAFTARAVDDRGGTAGFELTVTGASSTSAPDQPLSNGLQLWLKADAGVTADGTGSVSVWEDQSPNLNHAFQDNAFANAGENYQPQRVLDVVNGKPVIRFDGVDDFMTVWNSASLQPLSGDWTVIFVGQRRPGSRGDFPQIIGSRPWTAGADKGWAVCFDGNGLIGSHFADGTAGHDVPQVRSATGLSMSQFQSWEVEENRGAGFTGFYLNGGADRVLRTAMPVEPIDQFNDIYIGSELEGADNRRASVDLAEIIIYNRALTTADREQIAAYFSERYGLVSVEPVIAAPVIARQPESVTRTEGQTAVFNVQADVEPNGMATLLYQWQRDGVDIPGAFQPEYSVSGLTPADDGAKFQVVISNAGGTVTSQEATLTVIVDEDPPELVSARRHFLDFSQVHVLFSEAVAPESALDPSNYTITPGISVLGAEAGPNPRTVILSTTELAEGSEYRLRVSGVRDLFGNTIAAGTEVTIGLPGIVPHYSDTFTLNEIRTDGLYNDNSQGAYEVENSHGNPGAVWLPHSGFSFNTPASSTDPDRLALAEGNQGADTGLAQSGGGDFSLPYGLADNYLVQVDAILRTDRLDISSLPEAGGNIFGPQKLSLFFRRDSVAGTAHPAFPDSGLPGIGIYNGSVETAVRDAEGNFILTGIDDDNWHTFAVQFDQPNQRLGILVNGDLKALLDLATFAGGIYSNYSNGAVGIGGAGGVGWFDNFLVGAIAGGGEVAPATLSVQRDGQNIVVSWQGSGALEEAPTVRGPWTPLPNAASPYSAEMVSSQKFFRARQ